MTLGAYALIAPIWAPLFALLVVWFAPKTLDARWVIVPAGLVQLAVALSLPIGTELALPWLFTGSGIGLSATSATLWLLGGLLWPLAALYAGTELMSRRFATCYLLAMAGYAGLVGAADVFLFYTSFASMSFAGWGLVLQNGDDAARRAGRWYLVFAILGELALFAGLVLAVGATGTHAWPFETALPLSALTLLSLGFAIKAGVLGVHMWLPLAHPAAPVPASAVLSGAMIKAGLVGALGVIGVGDLSAYAGLLIPLGIGAALLGALAGISQTNAKTLLAYSSISQMGLMIVIVGLMLAAAEPAAALALLMLFMLNHGLAKGALFLAVGVSGQTQGTARWLVLALTALPALALIGLAPTAGYAAKEALEALAYDAAAARLDLLPMALTMSSVATALLMLRLTLLLAGMDAKAAARPAPVLAFATLALLSLATPLLPAVHGMSFAAFAPVQLIDSGEPLAIALGLMAVAYVLPRHLVKPIPAGDVILLIEAAWQQMLKLIHALDAWAEALDRWWQARLAAMQAWLQRLSDLAGSIEQQLARWPVMGAALVAILFVLVALGQQGGV